MGYMAILAGGLIFSTGCDDNDELIITDPDAEFDGVLEMSEGGGSQSITIPVDPATQLEVDVRVAFTSTNSNMRRLYITQEIAGQGAEAFELQGNVDNKADGSLDIPAASSNDIEYMLSLPVPDLAEGTVVYQLWTTSGRGDFRDQTKRLVAGIGTITLTYGGVNPAAEVNSFSAKLLAAPLADGSSNTFISLTDGTIFRIDQGEEFAAFWDFGYYFGASGPSEGEEASLASTSAYEEAFGFVDVDAIAGTTELNEAFFALSTRTSADFDAVTVAGDLNSITTPTNQQINNLEVGNIVEFVDNYGNKGLIRIVEIVEGFGSNASMTIDIKVQPN